MARDDDELAALSDELEHTDPRLAGALSRFRPSSRPLLWVVVPVVAFGLAAVGWWLDARVVVAVAIVFILGSPLLVALAGSRAAPPGGVAPR